MVHVQMTEAEVTNDFSAALRKIGQHEGVVVDRDGRPIAFIKVALPQPRPLSELIELATERERVRGYAITLDEDYASDVEQIVSEREPLTPISWE